MSSSEPKPSSGKAAREQVKFCCRLCGHHSYTEVRAPRPVCLGGPRSASPEVLHCVCDGCSAVFVDPKKFSGYIRPDLP